MRRALVCLMLLLLPATSVANDWDALDSPTAIVLMRHALAPGTGDPAGFDLDDCGTQRNLDSRGRDQARGIGAALRARGIDIAAVWTSQWCRSHETATLLDVAAVTEVPSLNSFFSDRSRAGQQTDAVLDRLGNHDGGRLVLVTHQVNITALSGVFPRSGEMIVAEMESGDLTVTGRILIGP